MHRCTGHTCELSEIKLAKMQNGNVNGEEDEEFQVFLSLHSPALKAARIPPLYWKSLHLKLANEVKYTTVTAVSVCVPA